MWVRLFFPLDKALGLLPGQCTPRLQEAVALLSTLTPFQAAVDTLARLLGVRVSKASAVRETEAAGAAYVALQTAEVAALEQHAPEAPVGAECMVVSADGAMAPLLHGEWGEVRTVAIGVVPPTAKQPSASPGDAPFSRPGSAAEVRHTQAISYFSRLTTAEDFTRAALVETHRRGVEHARQVAAVMDGADWLQTFADHHCPKAIRILDFAHAAQRLDEIGKAVWGERSVQATAWTTQWAHRLKHEGPLPLLTELRDLRTQFPASEPLRINATYLEKRQAQLQYPQFIQQGWPIGSGIIESANKLVVEARLKGAGMHWQRTHVDPMLALRNLVCNDRWAQEWPHIQAHRIAQAEAPRLERAHQRRNAQRTAQHEATLAAQRAQFAALHPEASIDAQPTPESPKSKSHKPPPNHPWRRSPIGQARYSQKPKT